MKVGGKTRNIAQLLFFLHLGKIFVLTGSSALGFCNGIRMKTWAGEFLAGKIKSIFFFTNQEAGRVGKYP